MKLRPTDAKQVLDAAPVELGRVEHSAAVSLKVSAEIDPPLSNGLVKKAPSIDPLGPLPPGIQAIRRAEPKDAEAIAAIQAKYQLRAIDAADHPANGWLVQKSAPDTIKFAMERYKEFWVAENDAGNIVAFQAVTPPRFISRPVAMHKLMGPYKSRAMKVLESGRFLYMSQIATDPDFRGKGVAAALQARVLSHFQNVPLVAHVAVFTQNDFDHWDQDKSHFEPHDNNVVSHRYHQKHGYEPVAWTSDLQGTVEYNSGLTATPGEDAPPPVLGILYMNFRDGKADVPHAYVDPVQAVLDSPCKEGEAASAAWTNPFSPFWPESEYDMSGDWDCGFVPNYQGMYDFYLNKYIGELDSLRA